MNPISPFSHVMDVARQTAERLLHPLEPQQPQIDPPAPPVIANTGLIDATQAKPSDWMGQAIDPNTSLADITIPGTHDSGAMVNGTPLPNTANAQTMTPRQQLDSGVRFLDLRFKADENGNLHVYHGPIKQPQSGAEALRDVHDFLQEHPGETVVVSIKNEGATGGQKDAKFQDAVEGLMKQTPNLFSSTSSVPKLGDVQGQAVLVRRYAAPQDSLAGATKGIDATGWPDNTAGPVAGGQLQVSDHYEKFDSKNIIPDEQEKWSDVQIGMDNALRSNSPALSITFASATDTSWPGIRPNAITKFSDHVNPQLVSYASGHRGGAGVVAVDRADPALIRSLIDMNSKTPGVAGPVPHNEGQDVWSTVGDSALGLRQGASQLWEQKGDIANAGKQFVVDKAQDAGEAAADKLHDIWNHMT